MPILPGIGNEVYLISPLLTNYLPSFFVFEYDVDMIYNFSINTTDNKSWVIFSFFRKNTFF